MTSSPARWPNAAPSCRPRRRSRKLRRAHLQSFVDRFKAKASKAVQAQSRVKMLEKMTPITPPEEAKKQVFTFPAPEELSPPIINLDGAAVGYGGTPVLRKLNLRIDQDDRIALLGRNGEGKSTLSKLLAGKLAAMRRADDQVLQAAHRLFRAASGGRAAHRRNAAAAHPAPAPRRGPAPPARAPCRVRPDGGSGRHGGRRGCRAGRRRGCRCCSPPSTRRTC